MQFTCPECGEPFQHGRPEEGQALQCPECGHTFGDPDPTVMDELGPLAAGGVAPGKELAGFRIEEKVGTGAMGEVYRATQLSLDRTVAIKVLPRAFASRRAFVQRFHEESTALSALNHPNIVTIIERGNVGDIYFFVMEYVPGPSLSDLMTRRFTVEEFLRVAKGMAAALNYAHEHGVVHRDIKPSNVMVSEETGVKIADFGLAGLMAEDRKAAEQGNKQPRRMGTPAYMSPEQKMRPLEVDGRTDIYAAGVVFHELVTEERPDVPLAVMPSELDKGVDPRLDPVIARCLAVCPDDRYQGADELEEDLERLEDELADAPRCPACGQLSPVRFRRCAYCDESLEEFFDICPECKHKNRWDVHHCLACGTDLQKGRTLISNKVTMMLDEADRLRLDQQFDEALEILEEVRAVEGKAFRDQRQRAEALGKKVQEERRETARLAYREGKRLVREHRFNEAIQMFRRVPQHIKDTTEVIKATRQLQARLARERRSETTTNLILIAMAVVLLITVILKLL